MLGKAIKVKPSWLNQTTEDIRRLSIKLSFLEDRIKKLEKKQKG